MVKFHIFIEGGGERGQPSKNLPIEMRRSFKLFISKAGIDQGNFEIARCGSRDQAFKGFEYAAKTHEQGTIPLLLVDSEDAVPDNTNPWDFLYSRDGWKRPEGVRDEHVHLMTHCMETWFLADMDALTEYFGNGFHTNSLPQTQPIEAAPKKSIFDGLNNAAKSTSKRKYDKGDHSFAILAILDPFKVQRQALWACRLFKTMDDVLVHKKLHQSIRKCQEPVYQKQDVSYP
ncbi:MAG: DUF4276 family protein [Magnetococcus sp. MYC-9]